MSWFCKVEEKVVVLVNGGSVINEATASSLLVLVTKIGGAVNYYGYVYIILLYLDGVGLKRVSWAVMYVDKHQWRSVKSGWTL